MFERRHCLGVLPFSSGIEVKVMYDVAVPLGSPHTWKNDGGFADRSPAIGQQVTPAVVLNYGKQTRRDAGAVERDGLLKNRFCLRPSMLPLFCLR